MANFTLDNAEIVRAVLQVAGLGRDAANMDTPTEADVRHILRSGLRRFFFPVVEGGFPYQWRFREKHHPISIVGTFEEGTIAVSGGTVTLTGDVFPDDMVDYFILVSDHVLFVTEDTDATNVEVSHTQLEIAAGTAYVAYKYRYALPSDFGEWLGGVVYANGNTVDGSRILANSSESEIRLRYAVGQGTNTRTTHYAITQTPGTTAGTTDSKILFWPVPEPDAFVQGTFLSVPSDNLPADLTTPGSTIQVQPIYAEAVLEAILTAAEEYNDNTNGVHSQRFQVALQMAIAHDRAIGGAYDFSTPISDYRGHGPVISAIDFSSQL